MRRDDLENFQEFCRKVNVCLAGFFSSGSEETEEGQSRAKKRTFMESCILSCAERLQ